LLRSVTVELKVVKRKQLASISKSVRPDCRILYR
jgi:hypothetical protein